MRNKSTLLAIISFLLFVPSAVHAQVQHTEVKSEQHKARIDGETGQVDQEHTQQKDSQVASPSGAVSEHSKDKSVSVQTTDGSKSEAKSSDKKSAAVTTEADGDISVEQNKEHVEENSTR